MMQRTVIDELKDRGFIFQMTETGVEEAAKNEKLIVYVGFDPTGASLHVEGMSFRSWAWPIYSALVINRSR